MLGDFFGRNPVLNNFYFKLFLRRYIFLAALSHKLNVIFHKIHIVYGEFSNPTDTSAENVTLCGSFTELAELNYLCIYTLYYFDEEVAKIIGGKTPSVLCRKNNLIFVFTHK